MFSTRTCIITNNDDDTAQLILPLDGTNSGVVKLESINSMDPPLSQPEVSSGQSRNGWVHIGTFTFNNDDVPSWGIRIHHQPIDRNNGVTTSPVTTTRKTVSVSPTRNATTNCRCRYATSSAQRDFS